MTGKTYFRGSHDLLCLIVNEVRASKVKVKGVYPAVVADGTLLCGIRVSRSFYLGVNSRGIDHDTEKDSNK